MEAAAHGHSTLGIPQSVGKEFVSADDAPIAPQAGPNGRAAGIMFRTVAGEVLYLLRGDGGDFPNTWGLPGGHVEEGETLEQAARRETLEETGFNYDGDLSLAYDDGQFATFLADGLTDKFNVTTCEESNGSMWASTLPINAHPGVAAALDIASIHTELDAARLVMRGILPSPTRYANMSLFDLRVTGTSTAYRSADDEMTYRPPELYLNDEFLQRCNGLPVVWVHPDAGRLNSEEYKDRTIGAIMLPYIKGDEVWGIARIYDDDAIHAMTEKQLSTSPGVVFRSMKDNATITDEEGNSLLIEGTPALLDHLAICEQGVWDKGGNPAGITLTDLEGVNMSDAENKESVKDDSAPAWAGKMMDKMDAMTKRMDAMESKSDKSEYSKADASGDIDHTLKGDPVSKHDNALTEHPSPELKTAADEFEEDKEKMDDDEMEGMADAQCKADSVFQAHGLRAPRAMDGEKLDAYRKRLVKKVQAFSAKLKGIDFSTLKADSDAFGILEGQVYADALAMARSPIGVPAGSLRAINKQDQAGRTITEYVGTCNSWMSDFKRPAVTVSRINKDFA